jgi:hypothetical protein
MDTAVSWEDGSPTRCSLCWEAGCEVYDYAAAVKGPIVSFACQRDDAYTG